MGRFVLHLLLLLFGAFLAGIFIKHAVDAQNYLDKSVFAAKLVDFDFAAYAFGLVAVAVSLSGVYVSIVPDSCIGQLKARAAAHLTPAPFDDWRSIRNYTAPSNPDRPPQIKGLYVLAVWNTIGKQERRKLLEDDGLDQAEAWFNKKLEWFDNQRDRLLAVVLGSAISISYLFVPLIYPFFDASSNFALLVVIYILCLLDVIVCAGLFWFRMTFVKEFDSVAKQWHPICENYLARIVIAPNASKME